ncbi:hypothetical protein SO802_032314 [Lithocarpus litseifolius]|uniref:Uncharacterized protein n=1 Tax=Lithocarpus litseifolius TaxID=425828 RepID=A0AAW2BPT4_9ROSI
MILICLVATGVAKTAGSILKVFSGPVFVISFLSIAYLIISREEELHELFCNSEPFFVGGRPQQNQNFACGLSLFLYVSAAELIGIILFVVCFILEFLGLRFVLIGPYCLAISFLPVARESFPLRLIHIPFEHARRYWTSHNDAV